VNVSHSAVDMRTRGPFQGTHGRGVDTDGMPCAASIHRISRASPARDHSGASGQNSAGDFGATE